MLIKGVIEMKIAIVVPIVGNFGRKGFYHSQEIGLGKELVSLGHNVTIYKCVSFSQQKNIATEKLAALKISYIPTHSIGPHGLFNVNLIDLDTDIVFIFSDTQMIIPKLFKFCKMNNIKFIPYVGIAHSFQRNFKSKLMDIFFKFTTLRVYRKVTVITKTIAAKEELLGLGVKNCLVAPVGMDFSALNQKYESFNRKILRKDFNIEPNDIVISFIARMSEEKHPIQMLEIFAELKNKKKKLIMIGKGPLENLVHLKAKQLNIEKQIIFFREVKYEDMWKFHYISDYFVNLRSDEIFGMAIMEAVYYKSSVIALSAPGPSTILNKMPGHYLCDNYEQVKNIIDDNNINLEALEISKHNLVDTFTWETCCNYITSIYKNSLA